MLILKQIQTIDQIRTMVVAMNLDSLKTGDQHPMGNEKEFRGCVHSRQIMLWAGEEIGRMTEQKHHQKWNLRPITSYKHKKNKEIVSPRKISYCILLLLDTVIKDHQPKKPRWITGHFGVKFMIIFQLLKFFSLFPWFFYVFYVNISLNISWAYYMDINLHI